MGMSAQALKRLENLKIDKLKQIRRPTPPARCANNKLPALSGMKKYYFHCSVLGIINCLRYCNICIIMICV